MNAIRIAVAGAAATGALVLAGTALAAAHPATSHDAAGAAAAGTDQPPAGTEWTWPLGTGQPVVVRGFDPPAEPWHAGHRGVDLLGAVGADIWSAGAGVVTYAGPVAGIGVVTVAHGEIRTTYQPVAPVVAVGQSVAAGEMIGSLDSVGSHCPPAACLHWGALRANDYLDPLTLVQPGGRVRLAPLGDDTFASRLDEPVDSHGHTGTGHTGTGHTGAGHTGAGLTGIGHSESAGHDLATPAEATAHAPAHGGAAALGGGALALLAGAGTIAALLGRRET